MTYASGNILQPSGWAGIMHCRVKPTLLVLLCLTAASAMAQDKPAPKPDDLDVTMQIITDPDAKLPDEAIRHIPLPPRKPAAAPQSNATETTDKGQQRASESKELGREASERAKERAKESAEQREQASRSAAEERRRNPPKSPPPRRPR